MSDASLPIDDDAAAAVSPSSPVRLIPGERPQPEEGTALCLSGGGYRAMLFHLGVVWRLNELGLLPKLKRVSSVSGGSITAGVLGMKWNEMRWNLGVAEDFEAQVVRPLRALAGETIDKGSVIRGVLLPGTVGDRVVNAYRKHLFGDATLQALPTDAQGPRFVINATNVQTGVLWRFSRPYMADYRVGQVKSPQTLLALAVAASSAFPPVLSPARLKLKPGEVEPFPSSDLRAEPYTTDVVLTDGGVYDNLGLETAWKRYRTVLVSDGGGQMEGDPKPHSDWARHGLRINTLIDSQVRSLRKRQVVGSLVAGHREGAYWRTRGDITKYPAPDRLSCPRDRTLELARLDTRLAAMPAELQERLINWGYALSDAAVRAYVHPALPAPAGFPYPRGV